MRRMNNPLRTLISGLLGCMAVCAQSQRTVQVCDLTDGKNGTDCYFLDSSKIAGLRIEDYKVANPAAVQFDPAVRLKELAALGPSTTATLCLAARPPALVGQVPSITFDKTS